MPEFQPNARQRGKHPCYALDDFAEGYVEAMFFTNGDTGDEREDLLNAMGVERLTKASVAKIADDCARFQAAAADLLAKAYAECDYDSAQAGRDFWFTRQGHGVGFWDRKPLDDSRALWRELGSPRVGEPGWAEYEKRRHPTLGDKLSAIAKTFGESYVETWRGWIHVR